MGNIKDNGILDIRPTNGTYAHASGVTEDTAITLTTVGLQRINNILLDFVNLTQNVTVRVEVEVDASTARTIDTLNWVTTDDDGVMLGGFVSDVDVTVTIQSAIAEGAGRNIPYRVL